MKDFSNLQNKYTRTTEFSKQLLWRAWSGYEAIPQLYCSIKGFPTVVSKVSQLYYQRFPNCSIKGIPTVV